MFVNVLPLVVFIMKRNSMRCQREKSINNIGLRVAGDADTKIFEMELNKVLNEVEDLLVWREYARDIGTLVQGIYDQINHQLPWEFQHISQAFDKCFDHQATTIHYRSRNKGRKGFCSKDLTSRRVAQGGMRVNHGHLALRYF